MSWKNISLILIAGIIISFLVLNSNAQTKNNEYVLLTFKYDNGNFSLLNKSLETGNYPASVSGRAYNISLLSQQNILYTTSFNPELLYSDEGNEVLSGGVIILNQTIFYVLLPNFQDLQNVSIVQGNSLVFEQDIHDVGATSCRIV